MKVDGIYSLNVLTTVQVLCNPQRSPILFKKRKLRQRFCGIYLNTSGAKTGTQACDSRTLTFS